MGLKKACIPTAEEQALIEAKEAADRAAAAEAGPGPSQNQAKKKSRRE